MAGGIVLTVTKRKNVIQSYVYLGAKHVFQTAGILVSSFQ